MQQQKVFSNDLKVDTELADLRSSGREVKSSGAQAVKTRSPFTHTSRPSQSESSCQRISDSSQVHKKFKDKKYKMVPGHVRL